MQDLPLAQNRDRPAYCFQHIDLELQSATTVAGRTLPPPAMLASWHDVVARFEPEWNSLGENKTRSVNILGGVHDAGYTVLLRSPGTAKSPIAEFPHRTVEFS
jgi:hypothetical protein